MSEEQKPQKKKLPEFQSDQEESDFWDTHDSIEYFDETELEEVEFVDARPGKTQISLEFDPDTRSKLDLAARLEYLESQALIRMWVMERLEELHPEPTPSWVQEWLSKPEEAAAREADEAQAELERKHKDEWKYERVYAIARLSWLDETEIPIKHKFSIKKLVWTQKRAQEEVERLNKLNGPRGAIYYWLAARLEKKEKQT